MPSNTVVVEVLNTTFTIEIQLTDENGEGNWWHIFVYASTDDRTRKSQWDALGNRSKIWGKNKVIIGDFNDITSNNEKWGAGVARIGHLLTSTIL